MYFVLCSVFEHSLSHQSARLSSLTSRVKLEAGLMIGIIVKLELEDNIIKRVGINHRWVGFFIVFGDDC